MSPDRMTKSPLQKPGGAIRFDGVTGKAYAATGAGFRLFQLRISTTTGTALKMLE